MATRTAKGTAAQNDQLGDAVLAGRGEQADRVGADGEERHEAQVKQAGEAEGDVEAEAHEDVQRDAGDDLGEERPEAQRQPEDEQQRRSDERGCWPTRRCRSRHRDGMRRADAQTPTQTR